MVDSDWAKYVRAKKHKDLAWTRVHELMGEAGVVGAKLLNNCTRTGSTVAPASTVGGPADTEEAKLRELVNKKSLEELLAELPELEEEVDRHYEAHIQVRLRCRRRRVRTGAPACRHVPHLTGR